MAMGIGSGNGGARERLSKSLGKPDASEAEILRALAKEAEELEEVVGEEKADPLDEEWSILQRTQKPPNEIIAKRLDETVSLAKPEREKKEKSKLEKWYEELNSAIDYWEERSARLDAKERSSSVAAEAAVLQGTIESQETKYASYWNSVLEAEDPDRFRSALHRLARVRARLARLAAGK